MGKNKLIKFKKMTLTFVLTIMFLLSTALVFLPRKIHNTYAANEATGGTTMSPEAQSKAQNIVNLLSITQSDGQSGVRIKASDFEEKVIPFASDNTSDPTQYSVLVLSLVGAVSLNPNVQNEGTTSQTTPEFSITTTVHSLNSDASGYVPSALIQSSTQYSVNWESGLGFVSNKNNTSLTPSPITIATQEDNTDVFTKIELSTGANHYTFYIFQTNDLRYDNNGLSWHTTDIQPSGENTSSQIIEPGTNQTYSDSVQLKIDPTKIIKTKIFNHLYIDFWCNGEAYSLKLSRVAENNDPDATALVKIENTYYELLSNNASNNNNPTDTVKKANESNDLESLIIDNQIVLNFNVSGEYKIRIYDETYKGSKPTQYNDDVKGEESYVLANMIEYNFIVENKAVFGGFYVTIKSYNPNEENPEINHIVSSAEYTGPNRTPLNSQCVNRPVIITFHNVDSDYVTEIKNKAYTIEGRGNVLKNQTVYGSDAPSGTAVDLDPIVLSEEAAYSLEISLKTSEGNFRTRIVMFQILNSVRSVYEFENEQYPTRNDNIQTNIVKTYNLSQIYTAPTTASSLIYYPSMRLYGYVSSNFKLYIAKSNASIAGVANKKTITSKAELTLTGVATQEIGMKVVVKRDGNVILNTVIYNHNENEPLSYNLNYSTLGNYTVQITDGMNNTTSLQFTIAQKQNAAGIILIVVGCVAAAGAIIFIIRARSKVAVR